MINHHYIPNGNGGQIHIAECGVGPAVLLIHQTPRSHDEFREVMESLSGQMRLIAMDLPGMGRSDSTESAETIETYARAASKVAQWAQDDNLTVCGHHTGAVVACELASNYGSLAGSILLSSVPWIDKSERQRRKNHTPIDDFNPESDGSHFQSLWDQRAPYYNGRTDLLDRFMVDAARAKNPSEGHLAVGAYMMEKAVMKIKCPVGLVFHEKDPFAMAHCENVKNAFSGAAIYKIEDGRVALEATHAKFANILSDWVFKHTTPRQPARIASQRAS